MAVEEEAPEVICAGMSCLDMILTGSEYPLEPDSICRFTGTSIVSGGSVPNTSCSLVGLGIPVAAVTLIGEDIYGDQLLAHLEKSGVNTSLVRRDKSMATSLAVVPVYDKGGRGCFVNLGANSEVLVNDLLEINDMGRFSNLPLDIKAFHFGYPHLLPGIQGKALKDLLLKVRETMPDTIISMDVNGANVSESNTDVLTSALPYIGMLHANLAEASRITNRQGGNAHDVTGGIESIAAWFTDHGVGIMCITCSQWGAYGKTHASKGVLTAKHRLPADIAEGKFVGRGAYQLSGELNATGAGDAFVAGSIAALIKEETCTIETLVDAGLAAALQRIDSERANRPMQYKALMQSVEKVKRLTQDVRESFRGING